MLQSSAKRSFDDQANALAQENHQVMKEVLRYFAQQKLKIQETRARLIEMNVTLPVQIAVRPVPEVWQLVEEQERLDGGQTREQGNTRDGVAERLGNAMGELSFVAEQTLRKEGGDGMLQRLSVDSISIQTRAESGKEQTSVAAQTSSFATVAFYTFVICVSIGYLWHAISDMTKKELQGDKLMWSPVPTLLRRLKGVLSSTVVRSCGKNY
ncbi:unnamed protein product [Phytophthora fragariaefolia]|uniref:Unnamed protein product n=1 Tax=Phytophthora fragariaefolia TaxID=1490495 RepID=A0A9W6XSV7_9STRA|nr:unnamed protein product [Phytophthora fragariaefolia]